MLTVQANVSRRCQSVHRRARRARVSTKASYYSYGSTGNEPKKVVVVGGGWAGFGAAKHLSSQGYDVTLLDAAANPGGVSAGWRTAQGRAVEAGIKGFWYQYHNIFALLRELGGEWPLTPFTTSGFWNPDGLMAEAPVFSRLPRLPTVVGQFVHTFPLFQGLPIEDRLSMIPMLAAFTEFDADEQTYLKYDRMTARELFRQYGVSQRCYERFLRPLMLVGLFASPEDVSAASMMECLYFYALAHQNDFDVCWCKGSIGEKIFTPLVDRIFGYGSRVLGSRLVTSISLDPITNEVSAVACRNMETGDEEIYPTEALVFAVGITGMQKLVGSCPELAARKEFRSVMNLRAIDCVATRLWLDRKVETRFPANVLSGFEDSAGGTFFNLNDLQDEYRDEPGSVISADFYSASSLLPLTDDEISARVLDYISACEPGFRGAQILDSAVLRFPKAVTHFSPGSFVYRPFQTTTIGNTFICGDWVKGVPHGANGLSQERAYVTGLVAANLVVERLGVGQQVEIIPVEADEPHVAAVKSVNRAVREVAGSLGLKSPFL